MLARVGVMQVVTKINLILNGIAQNQFMAKLGQKLIAR